MNKYFIAPMIGIGDVLMTTPALSLLKKYKPDANITCCTMNKGAYEVLKNNTDVDRLIYYPFLGNKKYFTLIKFIKENAFKYDKCINFYPSNRLHYNIISMLTFAPERLGHSYLRMNTSQLNWLKNRTITEDDTLHCVEENVKLLELLDIVIEKNNIPQMKIALTEKEVETGFLFRKNVSSSKCCIGVHAGTSVLKGHDQRRWSKEKFSQLISDNKDSHFILFGSKDEQETNQFIYDNANSENISLVNNKSIREVASIIKACDFFLSNDSGLMHLAASVGKPVLALVGPTNPVYIRPWGVDHRVISADVSCCSCFRYSPKPLHCTNNNKFQCLADITVEMVNKHLRDFIKLYGV